MITKHLIEVHDFNPIIRSYSDELDLDLDLYTCSKRIHVLHYLFYSEIHKAFSIGVLYETPKGQAGGGYKNLNTIMIPKVIYTTQEADLLIEAIT